MDKGFYNGTEHVLQCHETCSTMDGRVFCNKIEKVMQWNGNGFCSAADKIVDEICIKKSKKYLYPRKQGHQ